MRILIVEDEKELLESIAKSLRLSGYAVDTAADGEEGENYFWSNVYDLIILDVNLPKIDGFTLLKHFREEDKQVNIMMLTARTRVEDRVQGLDWGANDYLIKPFHFDELEARIRSLLRRKQVVEDRIIVYRGLRYDTAEKILYKDDEIIKLTAKETGIFEYLLFNQGRYISAEEFMEHVWDAQVSETSNAVRVHMSALRRKIKEALGENVIENEIGRGYRIVQS